MIHGEKPEKESIDNIILNGVIRWQKHALQRMMERSISRADVKRAVISGIIIESYEDDKPYPSFLIADIGVNKALHVVAAFDFVNKICYIITAYIPERDYFEADLITRRK